MWSGTGDNDAVPSVPPLPPDRPDLAERYGVARRGARSRLPLVVIGLVIVGMLIATGWALAERSTGVRAGVLAYGDITPTSITITLEVVRDPGQPVVCDVAAVGELQIDVGAARVEASATEARAVAVKASVPDRDKDGPRTSKRTGNCSIFSPTIVTKFVAR